MTTVTPDHSTSPRKTLNKRVTKEKVRRLIEAAEAAGKQVVSVTVDGVTLEFSRSVDKTEKREEGRGPKSW